MSVVDEALELPDRYGGEAKPLGGGQSLVPLLAFRLARPRYLVDLAFGFSRQDFFPPKTSRDSTGFI